MVDSCLRSGAEVNREYTRVDMAADSRNIRRMEFGPRLKTWRKARQMTQVRLAKRAATTQSAVSRVERGDFEASARMESALIGALGISGRKFWNQLPRLASRAA